ncbi:CdiA family toxin C-terminal domain-containing protein [Priestia megaterium]|uniref:CdiA family toxin C-terminal domain-containing protein n=1 Tax=Priestia megaterium TaxID=1404 RepID=UPI001FAEBDAE|nr:CdiA family toxin C-terminal domain-containing protein [Priestia megaterium]
MYEPFQKQIKPLLDGEIPTLRPQLVGIGKSLPGKTFGEALNGLTTYKIGNVSKGQSKALKKVEKPGGKADVEGVHDQAAVSKGTSKDITFKQGYDKHLIEVEDIVRKKNKGIVGGHNMENFENAFIENGWDLQSCIISKRQHSTIEGIYEIEYGLPALNREGNIIPGELKKV